MCVGKSLIFPIPLFLLPKFDAGKPGGESVSALLHSRTLTEFSGQSGRRVRECVSVYRRAPRVFRECPAIQHCAPRVFRINQRAGMQLKYFGSKAWLAPHMDRLLGDVAVLHSPFFGSGKLEYYLAARRPGLEVRGVDAFEPVANLHRCYLRRDPVFLRSLLRLVGRRVDRRFYSGRLLPGALRGRAGRRAACAYVLLRNSFSGKWGSFAQQRPLALSSVRRLQPPCNVTVRHQDALAYLRALPCLAHQCIYADPPYIFPGRSMNYYGTRGGHDLVFHTELRDALFVSGLPFVLSVNDVPEARELYSGADSITSLCSGKNSSKPELLVMHRGNPVASTGMGEAILLPQQD